MSEIIEKILESKVVAIIRGISSDYVIDTVQALKDGGIVCVEITFNPNSVEASKDTLKSIRMVREYFKGEIALGAGTVMTAKNVEDAYAAGAEYMISPNVGIEVIKKTKQLGAVSIPGAVTPTEAVTAVEAGADIIKLFPAGDLGVGYLKSLTSPLSHIRFMATGGIHAQNAQDFIKAGAIGVGVGGNLVNKKLIEAGRFEEIRKLAKEYRF
jgi:2-dehydro-3-deoxyphosphogluconate aldolase/(4S)-4-hydroxy-2-oxoglutarate aldolase